MTKSAGVHNVADLLVRHEEALAKLYSAYAKLYPAHQFFWKQTASEELSHAAAIKELIQLAKEGDVWLDKSRFSAAAIKTSLDLAEQETARATPALPAVQALSVAWSFESAAIDGGFFDVFAGNSKTMEFLVATLKNETLAHIKKVERIKEELVRHKETK